MLSHPRPRAHLSPILLIPPVVASASLTLTQHAAAALIPSHHNLHLSFSGLEPLNLSTLHLTRRLALVALLNMNAEPFSCTRLPNTASLKSSYFFHFFFHSGQRILIKSHAVGKKVIIAIIIRMDMTCRATFSGKE